jgi:hypothetical protein
MVWMYIVVCICHIVPRFIHVILSPLITAHVTHRLLPSGVPAAFGVLIDAVNFLVSEGENAKCIKCRYRLLEGWT